MKHTVLFVFVLIFTHFYVASGESLEKAPLYMAVGEQRSFDLGDFQHYSISGDSVRYTRLLSGQNLLLKAIKPGLATLILDHETRLIRVEAKKGLSFPNGLYQSLNGLREVEAIEAGEHFILRGILHKFSGKKSDPSDASRIAYLRDHFSKFIIDETQIDEPWLIESQTLLDNFLKNYPSLKLLNTEGTLTVQGSLAHKNDAQAITKKIKSIQPLTFIDIQSLPDHDPTVYFKVYLLEVKKEQLTQFGVGWPESQAGALHISPVQMIMNNPVDITLNALSQNGTLKILSSPELVVRAPGQAELFAGGEMPIRQKTKQTDIVIWKNIGLLLKLDVQSLAGDQVRLNIETQLSHIDQEMNNDNIPGVQSNHIKTQVDSPLGKPLLLSGLLQDDVREHMQGLPLLERIPILGALFSSQSYQKHESELVAILLPHRSPPAHPLQRISSSIPKGFLPIPRDSVSSAELEALKQDQHFPWNVL